MAMQDISSGEPVVSVPWSRCLSSEHIANNTNHPLSIVAQETRDSLTSADMLALFVLYEYHNPASEWAPYLCMLPRRLTSTIYW